MRVVPDRVSFHFDPMCPFAFHASLWMREVRERCGVAIDWRFFSLEEINRAEGKKHPWDRDWSYGWSMMRIGVALRRTDPELLDEWYRRIGTMLHLEGRKPHRPEVARAIVGEMGCDPGLVDTALADPTTNDEVLADHRRVTDAGGFGVPTLFFPDGQCLFGPVLVDAPSGEAAERLWSLVTGWLEFPSVFELQRPKGPAQRVAIARVLRPYLEARDWVSINRGEVIDFGAADPRSGS